MVLALLLILPSAFQFSSDTECGWEISLRWVNVVVAEVDGGCDGDMYGWNCGELFETLCPGGVVMPRCAEYPGGSACWHYPSDYDEACYIDVE